MWIAGFTRIRNGLFRFAHLCCAGFKHYNDPETPPLRGKTVAPIRALIGKEIQFFANQYKKRPQGGTSRLGPERRGRPLKDSEGRGKAEALPSGRAA